MVPERKKSLRHTYKNETNNTSDDDNHDDDDDHDDDDHDDEEESGERNDISEMICESELEEEIESKGFITRILLLL